MKKSRKRTLSKLNDYLQLSKSIVTKPIPHSDKVFNVSMALALFGALQTTEAQIVYSGPQNVPCNIPIHLNQCSVNIDGAGGNDFEIQNNTVGGVAFIQANEIGAGNFAINGFNGNIVGSYAYPYALAANAVIGAAGPWVFGVGDANSLADNGGYPNPHWETNGTTRFLGFRGVLGGGTKYGWIRITRNTHTNWTIVDWAYNNTNNQQILAGQIAPVAAGASISGQVLTPDGRALRNAVVSLTDTNGETRTARTSTFGYYRIDDIEVGQNVTMTVQSKGYVFDTQVVSVNDNLEGINFTGRLP